MIENKITKKCYIGQSQDIEYRWIHHKSDLRSNCHHNRHLQSSWNKYGEINFEFKIIEECDINELNEKKAYWISYYNSYSNGYNLDTGGNGTRGYKHTEEELEKMRRIQSPLIVLQFDLDFNLIKRYSGGISHVIKTIGGTKEVVLARCEKTQRKMTPYKNFYFVYEKEYEDENFTWEKYLNNEKIIDYQKIKNIKIKENKKILQLSLDKKLIKTWNNYKELKDAGFNTSQISGICNKSRGKKTAYGFIWCFEDYDFSDGYFNTLDNYYNKATENRKRKIIQFDKQSLKEINRYNSITEAANLFDISPSCISVALKKGTSSCGYFWKYA